MVDNLEKKPCRRKDCEVKRDAAERRRVEERLADAQRIAHIGHWDWDIVTSELAWSDEIYRIFGLQPQEFGATYEAFLERVHQEDRNVVAQAVNQALFEHATYSIDHRIVRPGGQVRIVHEQAEVSFDDQGKACRMLGTAQDVTESRTIGMELERKEEMLRRVLEALPVGVWIADATGRITTTNQAAIEIWGAAPHVGVSDYQEEYKSWDLKSGERLRSEHCPMARALLTGKPQSGREARIETFDGKARVIRSWGAPVLDSTGKVTGAIGVAEDITSKFAIRQALSRSHEDLRRLTQHQIRIRELEKASIAKNLHEGIGQTLSGALMQIASLRKDPAAKQELADKCAGLEAVLKEAIESIRRLSSELRPPLLDHFGLEDALDWLVVETREKSGIACSLSIRGKMPKGDDVRSLELFRICQDAFSNAIREGGTRIDVSVRGQRSRICLEVKDNGLLSSESGGENALAIIGMRERVAGMCGTFEIKTDPVHGRVASISIPRAGLYAQREQ